MNKKNIIIFAPDNRLATVTKNKSLPANWQMMYYLVSNDFNNMVTSLKVQPQVVIFCWDYQKTSEADFGNKVIIFTRYFNILPIVVLYNFDQQSNFNQLCKFEVFQYIYKPEGPDGDKKILEAINKNIDWLENKNRTIGLNRYLYINDSFEIDSNMEDVARAIDLVITRQLSPLLFNLPGMEVKISSALKAALKNAVIHGNLEDANKKVSLAFSFTFKKIAIKVKDMGSGFDYNQIMLQIGTGKGPDGKYNRVAKGVIPYKNGMANYLYCDEIGFNSSGNEVLLTFNL